MALLLSSFSDIGRSEKMFASNVEKSLHQHQIVASLDRHSWWVPIFVYDLSLLTLCILPKLIGGNCISSIWSVNDVCTNVNHSGHKCLSGIHRSMQPKSF